VISKKKIEETFYWKKKFNEKDKQRVEILERLKNI